MLIKMKKTNYLTFIRFHLKLKHDQIKSLLIKELHQVKLLLFRLKNYLLKFNLFIMTNLIRQKLKILLRFPPKLYLAKILN